MTRPSNVLDAIDHAVSGWETSPDAMRWTPDPPPPDRRSSAFRNAPPERQAAWAWWCPTCKQPLPQPRWHRISEPGGFAYHLLDDRRSFHKIERRTP